MVYNSFKFFNLRKKNAMYFPIRVYHLKNGNNLLLKKKQEYYHGQ